MSHRPTLRRNLAPSEPNPSSTDSTSKPRSRAPHKQQSQTKHPPLVDTLLQARAMTSSAIFDSSKYSLPKPTLEKEMRSSMSSRKTSKEKPGSSLLKIEKDCNNRSMVEDVKKIEKSRKPVVEEHHVVDDDDVIKRTSVSLAPRRRSFSGSQVDLGDVFAINGAKMVSADMPPFMQIHAVDCARKAFDSMEKFTSKTLALSLKKEFDGVYGPAWHCIVGTSFGSFVTHSVGGFLYFSMDRKLYILLFKTAVQKAD